MAGVPSHTISAPHPRNKLRPRLVTFRPIVTLFIFGGASMKKISKKYAGIRSTLSPVTMSMPSPSVPAL